MLTVLIQVLFLAYACRLSGSGLGILTSMNIQLLVVDPEGRKTGYDPRSRQVIIEMPSSSYFVTFTGNPEGTVGDSAREFEASFATSDRLIDGPYALHLFGQQSGPFWVSISVYREPLSEDFNIRGTIRKGEKKLYRLIYKSDLSAPVRIDTVGTE